MHIWDYASTDFVVISVVLKLTVRLVMFSFSFIVLSNGNVSNYREAPI